MLLASILSSRAFFKADLGCKNYPTMFQLHHDLGLQRNTISVFVGRDYTMVRKDEVCAIKTDL